MKGKRVMLEGGKEEKKRRGGEVILKREREREHTLVEGKTEVDGKEEE